MDFAFPVLIGDIGGTNARFALIRDSNSGAEHFDPVQIRSFDTIDGAIQSAVLDRTSIVPATMMLAIATPLHGDEFLLTNGDWVIRPKELTTAFNLESLCLMNDFAAQALGAIVLPQEDMVFIGKGEIVNLEPKVVVGPGTGLGIATLVFVNGKWAILSGEGGHIDIGPRTPREIEIWPHLEVLDNRVSAELVVSGQGLENLYQAICKANGGPIAERSAAEISAGAINAVDSQSVEAVELFLTLLARICGDMALIALAHGGVYIAGGIPQKIQTLLDRKRFRAEFENKAPHHEILEEIPVCMITNPNPALEGMAACITQPGRFFMEGFIRRFSGN
ncbi:MAG: glucokinase [Rhizobiaceae bacterium]